MGRRFVILACVLAALGCHHDGVEEQQAPRSTKPRGHVDAGATVTPPMHAGDAGAKPPHTIDAATSLMDATPTDAPVMAHDAGTRADSGTPSELCDWMRGESFVSTPELVFDAVTQSATPYVPNPLADPGASFLTWPRFDAARMPWIERDDGCGNPATDLGCSFDTNVYRSEAFGAQHTHYVLLVVGPYSVSADGTGIGGFTLFSNEEAADLRRDINAMDGVERVRFAPAIMPDDRIDLQLAAMDRWAPDAAAWSLTPGWSPMEDGGYWLDDKPSKQVIEHGLALHVPIFIVDKGMPLSDTTYSDPVDVGRVANKYPDARFVVRHAAFEHGLGVSETSDSDPKNPDADLGWGKGVGQWPEGPYDEDDADVQKKYPLTRGVNSLIKSLRDNGIEPNGKTVYVSLDEVWAHLITRPTEAAHVLGKLIKYVGEDNILFGTDSMYYGKPDPQLQKFREFQIPEDMQQRYGYPVLTMGIKSKILGLNAARLFCSAPR